MQKVLCRYALNEHKMNKINRLRCHELLTKCQFQHIDLTIFTHSTTLRGYLYNRCRFGGTLFVRISEIETITVFSWASTHGRSSITPCFSLYWALTMCKNRNAISGCGQRYNHDRDCDSISLATSQHVRAHCRMTCSTQKLHTLSLWL